MAIFWDSSDASLKTELNEWGYRLTPQRSKILSIFQGLPQGKHLSAEDVHTCLQHQQERISLSTIYRTLHLMVYMGLLRELELAEGHKHYELHRPYREHHHHLVCVSCNRTIEFKDPFITGIGGKQAESEGYRLLHCQLKLYGTCPDCNPSNPSDCLTLG